MPKPDTAAPAADTTTQEAQVASYQDQLAYASPEEAAIIKELIAAEQAGGDLTQDPTDDAASTDGDQEGAQQGEQQGLSKEDLEAIIAEGTPAAGDAGAAPGDGAAAEQAPGAGAQAATEAPAAQAAPQEQTPFVPQFNGIDAATFNQKVDELNAQKATALQKMMDGEITADEYAKTDSLVTRGLLDLNRQATLAIANHQMQEQQTKAAVQRIASESKAANQIDYYAEPEMVERFDRSMALVSQDPKFANVTAYERAQEAHRMVLAMAGKLVSQVQQHTQPPAAPAPAAAKPAEAPPKEPRKVPPSLGGLPNASQSNVGNDPAEIFASLTGQAAEDYFSRLPAHVQEQLMRGKAA